MQDIQVGKVYELVRPLIPYPHEPVIEADIHYLALTVFRLAVFFGYVMYFGIVFLKLGQCIPHPL